MRKPAREMALRLVAALAACASGPAWSLAPGAAAEIVHVQGAGEQRPASVPAWQPARVQQELAAGDFVRTLEFGRMALLFADQSQLRLHHKTVLQVKAIASSAQQPTNVLLQVGRAWMQTRRAFAGTQLRMETPTATLGIRGTDWDVEVSPDGHTLLTVLSGSVTVAHELGDLEVGPNESALVERGKAPLKIRLANPRDRVQWVHALVADPQRWVAGGTTPELAEIATQVKRGELAAAYPRLVQVTRGPAAPQPAYLLLADLQLVLGEHDAAIATLQAGLRAHPGAPHLRAELARAQLLADRLDDSRATLAPARADDPAPLWIARGALARREGLAGATLEAYGRATQLAPDDARGWFGLGSAHTEREDSVPARASLLRALQLDPRGPGYRGELGTLETFRNDLPAAEAAFAQALADNPSDYVARTGQGLLRLKQGRTEAALDDFLRAGVMEPRFARARTYTGVAYWQLGRHADAIATLQQAAALDDKDPLPHLFLAQIHTDLYRPGEAVQASREALARMPFVKSLNQVANDQQGRANLGASLAFFGLEDWAQELAHEAYYPYWGASHLFLADRYRGEFVKNSELFQGFLADPLAFGGSPRFATLLQRPGHYGTAGLTLDQRGYANATAQLTTGAITLNGLAQGWMPVAYFAKRLSARGGGFPASMGINTAAGVQGGPGELDARADVTSLGLGARPIDQLGLFAYANDFRLALPGPDDAPAAIGRLPGRTEIRNESQQFALGASWRWSPTAQTWLKLGYATDLMPVQNFPVPVNFETLSGNLFMTSSALKRFSDLQVRHTTDLSPDTQLAFTWEHVKEWQSGPMVSAGRGRIDLGGFKWDDIIVLSGENRIDRRFHAFTVAAQQALTPSVRADAALTANWVRHRVQGHRRLGLLLLEVDDVQRNDRNDAEHKVAPRIGVVWRPAPGTTLRVAYQDWLRPLTVGTLASVETAGIPVDDQLTEAGGRQRRQVVQLGWTAGERTFFVARLDNLRLRNPDLGGVDLRTPSLPFLEDLRNAQLINLASTQLLEQTPYFGKGRLRLAAFGVNHVLSPRVAGFAKYWYAESDAAPPPGSTGRLRIPWMPRHTLALGTTWASEQRLYTSARLMYRSARFEDDANTLRRGNGWALDVVSSWESADKRWLVRAAAQNLLAERTGRQVRRYLVDATYRF